MNEYQANQSMSAISNVMKLPDEYTNLAQDTLRCPICALATSNRLELTEHLMSHCTSTHNNSNLKAILEQLPVLESLYDGGDCSFLIQGEHTKHKTEKIDKPDHRVSHANPQGNVRKQSKSLREGKTCKQCSFVANTKMDYWEHMRCHIKGFNCSECSFVTKYKHHMNHHWLSVHDGSKPFKCKKCSYTCVSKSMLTSHSKKHSNIYPYRCANCTYKTKFCNALKKHLRKKEHQPAMVLNADGSPNPLCIIDVYSTKRGPKQKPSVKNHDELSQQSTNTMINDNQLDSAVTSPVSSYQSVARYLNVTALNGMNSANGINQNTMNQNQSVMMFPYSDLVAAFNLSNHLLLRDDATFHENMHKTDHSQSDHSQSDHSQSDHSQSDTLMEYTKIMKKEDEMPAAFVENSSETCFDITDAKESYNVTSKPSTIMPLKSQLEIQKDDSTAAPLDLRITEVIGKDQIQLQSSVTNSPKVTSTSRRKGRAMKLERRIVEEDTDKMEFSEFSAVSKPGSRVGNEIKDIKDKKFADLSADSELICHYCEIAFVNAIMYTVHMGYHGFTDPYTCNMCGHQCIDKLSFFLHIGRSEHHTRFDRGERSYTS